jgi:hypothetical protein
MDFLLSAADSGLKLERSQHGEIYAQAEMPLRFQFDAERLWLGKSAAANPAERRAVL